LRAFVTGATGFAGGHLCAALLAAGWNVRGLARGAEKAAKLSAQGVEPVQGDIRDKASFAPSLRGVDVVFHLAAVFREAGLPDSVYQDVNVNGTRNAIEAAAEANVSRFVHCSTIGVHGDTGSTPADETRSFAAADDPYNRTKIEGETLARELLARLGLPGTILRPTAGYGPGEMRYQKLFSSVKRGRFVMIGSGETRQNLIYTDDLCDAMLRAAERPEAVGETFLIGGRENPTLNELVGKVAQVLHGNGAANGDGVRLRVPAWPVVGAAIACETLCRPFSIEPPLHRRRVGFFTVNRAADVSKAQRLLGYESRVPLEEGLRRAAQWYESQGLL
jgi:nucleoside-diphosphate-sugar epimerase